VQELEEEKEWSEAHIIFGRLIGVDKKRKQITIEFKEGAEWVEELYYTSDWTNKEYEYAREHLGENVTLKVEDHNVVELTP